MATARHAMRRRPVIAPRPALRVIKGGANDPEVRSEKSREPSRAKRVIFFAVSGALIFSLVFGLVLLNVFMAQTSFRMNDLQRELEAERLRYDQMRYEVARAESPQKVAEAAAGLGLVAPEKQEYILGEPRTLMARADSRNAQDQNLKALLREGD